MPDDSLLYRFDFQVAPDAPEPAGPAEAAENSPGAPDFANLMTLYLRDVRRYRQIDCEHEARLFARINSYGDEQARDELICHHLGLVIALARKFSQRGLELLDLIEEGNLGMMVALAKFDPARGLRFSTYAVWWIRYYLQTAVATQVPIVRPPLRAQRRAGKEAWQQWCDSHGIERQAAAAPVPNAETPRAVAAAPLVTALALHDEDIDATLAEADLCNPDIAHAVAEDLDGRKLAQLLRKLVAALPERQRDVITARFGLDGEDEWTLQDLGSDLGVTRERMRQVQVAALKTLREGLEQAGVTRSAVIG
jgi:RNA polymerase sigma factor (sigma-70 family)